MPSCVHVAIRPVRLYIISNSPQRSWACAFNPAERSMAPLNPPLAGVQLPGFVHGVHLENKKVPKENEEMERKNFCAAIDLLAMLWKNVKVNGQAVTIDTIEPAIEEATEFLKKVLQYKSGPTTMPEKDRIVVEKFLARMYAHCSFSKYLGQIHKCESAKCCSQRNEKVQYHAK